MHLSCERLCKLAVVVFIKKATLLNKEHLKFDIGDYRGGGGWIIVKSGTCTFKNPP